MFDRGDNFVEGIGDLSRASGIDGKTHREVTNPHGLGALSKLCSTGLR